MGSFSNGPLIVLCLLISGSAKKYSTEEKLKYKFCKHYVEIGHLTGDLKPMTFWHVDCHDQDYFPLGDITAQGKRKPHNRAVIVKDENNGLLGRPKGLREIWRNSGNNNFTVFEMDCEHGFKALGNVVVKGSSQLPDLHNYRCVNETILVRGKLRPIWEEIGHVNRTNIGVWEVATDPYVASGSIPIWTFVFGNNHNIKDKIVYALNRNKVKNDKYASIQLMKKNENVCADLGSTEPTGSPFITLVPASTLYPRPHISDPSTFCNDKPDGNYAYPTNPHKYYRCSNGQTVVMNCPGGFVYSAIKDWPSDLIVDKFCEDRPNGNYSYRPDPHKYYACCDGNTELKDCPPDQLFINFERQCSWPRRF
ncbi:uncharacterized protein LOC113434555 [Pseudonaja textilis]|uniref:uncharacterized protein LOC113434555 n=1 Tax=Pseudonaja textilis TaxID=8673 RepID=UPI000EAA4D6E|nr:uncharacterized protein LOC113434555 [Pseudonaja textilis]